MVVKNMVGLIAAAIHRGCRAASKTNYSSLTTYALLPVPQDPSFPQAQFAMATDTARAAAYSQAIRRAVARRAASGQEVHAVDLGAGSGLLSLLCAKAGRSLAMHALHACGSTVTEL